MAVAAGGSMGAVAEATSPAVAATFQVAGGTTAHRAGGLSTVVAIGAARPCRVTEGALRTLDPAGLAEGQTRTQGAHPVRLRLAGDHFQEIGAPARTVLAETGLREGHRPARARALMHGRAQRPGTPDHRHPRPGLMASGIRSVAQEDLA